MAAAEVVAVAVVVALAAAVVTVMSDHVKMSGARAASLVKRMSHSGCVRARSITGSLLRYFQHFYLCVFLGCSIQKKAT